MVISFLCNSLYVNQHSTRSLNHQPSFYDAPAISSMLYVQQQRSEFKSNPRFASHGEYNIDESGGTASL